MCTERILGDDRFRDTGRSAAQLVLGDHPEEVFLLLDEFGHQVPAAPQRGRDTAPADLQSGVVLLLQCVVQDLAAAIVQRRIPPADHRILSHLLKMEVHRRTRYVCRGTVSQVISSRIFNF